MVKFQFIKTLKILLEPFKPDNYELNKFITFMKFDGYADHFYKIKKLLSRRYRENQQLIVSRKISLIRKRFAEFSGRQFIPENDIYLVRVDDYPHWEYKNDLFEKFAEIFEEKGINFLVGVVPELSEDRHNTMNKNFRKLSDRDAITLKKFSVLELALHGLTHQTIRKKPYSEFAGLSVKQTAERIEKGVETLKQFDFFPAGIISPFDTFNSRNFQAFSSFFKIICGGYPSASSFGFWISPCVINNSVYIASYSPFSGKAKNILRHLSEKKNQSEVISITIHWASEVENNFLYVKQIAEIIKGRTLSWKRFADLYCR